MMGEIQRIGLLSAGTVLGVVLAALVTIGGVVWIGATVAMLPEGSEMPAWGPSWDFEPEQSEEAEEDATNLDLEIDEDPVAEGGLRAALAGIWLAAAGLVALVAGFVLGVFLAALYNVVAGVAGGLRIEVVDPRPRDP